MHAPIKYKLYCKAIGIIPNINSKKQRTIPDSYKKYQLLRRFFCLESCCVFSFDIHYTCEIIF